MRIFIGCVLVVLQIGCTPFESPKSRAVRYEPKHLKNGCYQFDLATWPWSLAEFKQRHGDSLVVVDAEAIWNADGMHVVGMLVLTEVRETSHGSR